VNLAGFIDGMQIPHNAPFTLTFLFDMLCQLTQFFKCRMMPLKDQRFGQKDGLKNEPSEAI